MKRLHHVLFAILALLLLASCTGKPDAGGTGADATKNPPEVVSLVDYLASDDFDAHNAGIADGSSLPVELWYFAENSTDVTVTDQEYLKSIWGRLCALEVDVANIDTKTAVSDGSCIYRFTWEDGTTSSFGFTMNNYLSTQSGLVPIVDSSDLHRLAKELYRYEPADTTDETFIESLTIAGRSFGDLDVVASDGPNYQWDFDGDGSDETLYTQFVDLGDEAPSYIAVDVYLAGAPQAEVIDGAYEIREVRSYEAEDGTRGLAILYYEGDYYSHDNLAACTLSWNGEHLVMDYVS